MQIFKRFVKSGRNDKTQATELPTAEAMWGVFPIGSPFAHIQSALAAKIRRQEKSSLSLNLGAVGRADVEKPDYSGLCADYAWACLDSWCPDYASLLIPSFDDSERLRAIAVTSLFLEYGSLRMAMLLPESESVDEFINGFRVSVLRGFLLLDQSEERASRVERIVEAMHIYRVALSSDERQTTKEFLEQIGKTFLASIPGMNGHSSDVTSGVNKYMAKLFAGFKEGTEKLDFAKK